MRQWFFVLTGGFGLALTAAAIATIALDVPQVVAPAVTLAWSEAAAIAGGVVLGGLGYAGARRSGRRAVADGAAVDGVDPVGDRSTAEIAFACPTCIRPYRASSACGGRPFACRTCASLFTVPTSGAAPFAKAA